MLLKVSENKRLNFYSSLACNLHICGFRIGLYLGFTGRSMPSRLSKHVFWLVLVLSLGFCRAAKADTVDVDGTYAFASGGYGIPPYGGTLNGQSAQFYCVDFSDTITGGTSWNVTVTSLTAATSSFASTFLALKDGYTASGAQTMYMAMAYLVTQMMGTANQGLQAQYQYAIWSLTGGPQSSTSSSLVQAALNYVNSGKFNAQGWELLTPTGSYGQEFLVYAAEPSTLAMLLAGLLALALIAHKRLGA